MNTSTSSRILLFVAGTNDATHELIRALDRVLEERLGQGCSLEVIDVLSAPERAAEEQILITPTLILKLPQTERRLFGDLGDAERIHHLLDLADEG